MADTRSAIREAEQNRNRAAGAHVVFEPHRVFDDLRRRGDVVPGAVTSFFGLPHYPNLDEAESEFTVVGYDAVELVFREHETFSSDLHPDVKHQWGANILFMDEPEHRRYRALAQPAFALKTMKSWEEQWLRPILAGLLAELPDSGSADLYGGYCARFPARTIASAFGIPPAEAEQYHEWVLYMQGGGTPEQSESAARSIAESLAPIIEDRRASGETDDVIGLLAASEVDDDGVKHRLDDREILGFAYLMLTAGSGTTYRTNGFLLRELIDAPELLARVRADRALLQPVVEETLRWAPPVLHFERRAVRDTEVAGVHIPAGSIVYNVVGAANRDPRRWDRPHEFDPDRPPAPHVAFGNGPHFCLGNQLARMELRVATEMLLDRYDSIVLDRDEPYPEISGLRFRQLDALPVVVG